MMSPTKHHRVSELRVGLDFGEQIVPVARLAMRDQVIYREFERSFIERGIEISPLRLPLKQGVMSFDPHLFEGLPGVFNDSLPDGWGRLLFDRFIRSLGMMPHELSPLDRLAHIGRSGLGALVYEPDYGPPQSGDCVSLDQLAEHANHILTGTSDDVLEELLMLNGSSAGARPKVLIGLDEHRQDIIHGVSELPEAYSHWMVKFGNMQDGPDAGAIEYVYALMANEAGVEIPEVHLFPSQHHAGFFAVKRFDRDGRNRLHTHTACGLLHSDFRTPSLDYEDLLALTATLTRDAQQVDKLFRLAVFNVMAHNRDDHSKNFSYLMDQRGNWRLAPAYDLTYSSGPSGEQSTMVMGEGRNPDIYHLIRLGSEAKLSKSQIKTIIEQTQSALGRWESLAITYGVSAESRLMIVRQLLRA
jgi:serine/threonine-protein kinase HipA